MPPSFERIGAVPNKAPKTPLRSADLEKARFALKNPEDFKKQIPRVLEGIRLDAYEAKTTFRNARTVLGLTGAYIGKKPELSSKLPEAASMAMRRLHKQAANAIESDTSQGDEGKERFNDLFRPQLDAAHYEAEGFRREVMAELKALPLSAALRAIDILRASGLEPFYPPTHASGSSHIVQDNPETALAMSLSRIELILPQVMANTSGMKMDSRIGDLQIEVQRALEAANSVFAVVKGEYERETREEAKTFQKNGKRKSATITKSLRNKRVGKNPTIENALGDIERLRKGLKPIKRKLKDLQRLGSRTVQAEVAMQASYSIEEIKALRAEVDAQLSKLDAEQSVIKGYIKTLPQVIGNGKKLQRSQLAMQFSTNLPEPLRRQLLEVAAIDPKMPAAGTVRREIGNKLVRKLKNIEANQERAQQVLALFKSSLEQIPGNSIHQESRTSKEDVLEEGARAA